MGCSGWMGEKSREHKDWLQTLASGTMINSALFDRTQNRMNPDGRNRAEIKRGARVQVERKQDQRSGRLTEGIVKDILTSSPFHPHGIKVRLESGVVGRVKEVLPDS
jgi:uncharacterized repeat protein (TIGR03833 family)